MTADQRQPLLRCNASLPESREARGRYGHHPLGLYGKHQVNVSTSTGLCPQPASLFDEILQPSYFWQVAPHHGPEEAASTDLAGNGALPSRPCDKRQRAVKRRTSQRRVSVVQPCGLCPPHVSASPGECSVHHVGNLPGRDAAFA